MFIGWSSILEKGGGVADQQIVFREGPEGKYILGIIIVYIQSWLHLLLFCLFLEFVLIAL